MRKLTTEDFIRRSVEIHGNKYDYSKVEYVNNHTKVCIICPEHGEFWQVASSHLLGFGCQKCGVNDNWEKRGKMTTKEFVEKASDVHGHKYDYSKSEYKGMHNKVCIICPKHGEFWQMAYAHLNGRGCDKCGDETISSKLSMGRDNFIKKANDCHKGKYIYPDYLQYKNNSTKVPIICPKHGEFWQTPNNHLKGAGCPVCGNEKLKRPRTSKETFLRKSNEIHNGKYDYSKVDYKDTKTKVCIICPKHGEFYQLPKNHLHGQGCPKCKCGLITEKKTYTLEDFIKKSKEKHKDKYDYSQVIYINSRKPVDIICKKHGLFSQIPAIHLNGAGCPKCSNQLSNGENEIYSFVKNIDENVKQRVRNVINPFEIDILSEKHKIGIEFDGLMWHSEFFNKDKTYHVSKTNECEKQGIRLIHIFEDEYTYKKEIVLSRINNLFGVTKHRIFARKCVIKEINSKVLKSFLDENHLQGNVNSKYRYGLFYENELVAVMSFGKLRKNMGNSSKDNEYELLRYCSKLNMSVIGGASKLLKHFIKQVKPKRIITYADRRWCNGNMYKVLGFEHVRNSEPNYFYIIDRKRENRFKYRKDQLVKQGFDPNKSEHEIMLERGIPRIYDCGCMVFEMKL